MSNAEIVPIRADAVLMSLGDLAEAANTEHGQVVIRARQTLEHALKAGEYLTQVVETVEPGEWFEWVKINLTFTSHTAAIYLRLAHYRDQLGDATTVNMAMAAIKGLPHRRNGPVSKYPERLKIEALELYAQGVGAAEIGRRLGIPRYQVHNWSTGKTRTNKMRNNRREAALRALGKQDETRAEAALRIDNDLGQTYLELHAAATLLGSVLEDRKAPGLLIDAQQFIYKAEEILVRVIEKEAEEVKEVVPLDVDPSDREMIYGFARSAAWKVPHHRIPPSLDRDDLIQAAVIAALARIEDYDPEQGSLSTFLWARISGAIEDEIRTNQWPKRNAKIEHKPEVVELDRDTIQVAAPSPPDLSDLRDVAEQCQHLPPRERLIVTLHSFEGITLNDLAPVYGLTPSRMTQLWQEGVRQLQARLLDQ